MDGWMNGIDYVRLNELIFLNSFRRMRQMFAKGVFKNYVTLIGGDRGPAEDDNRNEKVKQLF